MRKFFKKILPQWLLKPLLCFWHYSKAILASLVYPVQTKKITLIGVAGTKGKTTVCHLISQILEKAGKKTALFSTTTLKIEQNEQLNKIKFTTPSPFVLRRFIRKAIRAGCQEIIIEVSSHGLIQRRLLGLDFKIIVLTNLIPDHLDYHKNASAYLHSHQKLLGPKLQYLILNGDDLNLKEFLKTEHQTGQKIIYGLKQNKKDIFAKDIHLSSDGSCFAVKTAKDFVRIKSPLLGEFNVYNNLAALAFTFSQNINLEIAKNALQEFKAAPGRMEKINQGQNFEIIVDYAHSPDSLKAFFKAVSCLKKNKVIAVFGACGDRDASQRPIMGKIIAQNCDYFILANDDPYNEVPEKIASQVLSGAENKTLNKNMWQILDRKAAIKKAVSLAKKNDLVLILGKGAEQYQIFKDKKIPWDDRKAVREILAAAKDADL